jgi:hypothetical protein
MEFTLKNPKPSDRSIFRKNIGRALLNKQNDSEYLKVWDIDYTSHIKRTKKTQLRDIDKEKNIESQVTSLLHKIFYFRLIPLVGQEKRMGKTGIESKLIGTIASCKLCNQSSLASGKYSPRHRIKDGKLWLSQHLDSVGITDSDQTYILESISRVKENVSVGQV